MTERVSQRTSSWFLRNVRLPAVLRRLQYVFDDAYTLGQTIGSYVHSRNHVLHKFSENQMGASD